MDADTNMSGPQTPDIVAASEATSNNASVPTTTTKKPVAVKKKNLLTKKQGSTEAQQPQTPANVMTPKSTNASMPPPGAAASALKKKLPAREKTPLKKLAITEVDDTTETSPVPSTNASPTPTPATQKKRAAPKEATPSNAGKRKKLDDGQGYTRPTHRMPSFQGGPGLAPIDDNDLVHPGADFMAFNSTIYEITLVGTEFKFHGHETVLKQSPKLAQEIEKSKAAKGRGQVKQTLKIEGYDPGAFEQMLQYLYKGKFSVVRANRPLGRLREYHELMSLAKAFQLPLLQKQIVAVLAKSNLVKQITIMTFFDWAEDMFYEETDHKDGPFKRYFARVAPQLLRANFLGEKRQIRRNQEDEDPDQVLGKILRQVKLGGDYTVELFRAMHTALISDEPAHIQVKSEDNQGTMASESTPDVDGDVKMEQNEVHNLD